MIKKFFVLFFSCALYGAPLFVELVDELAADKAEVAKLSRIEAFAQKGALEEFERCYDDARQRAEDLDDDYKKMKYLQKLRECVVVYEKITYYHAKALDAAMFRNDYQLYRRLLSVRIDEDDEDLRDAVIDFYEKHKDGDPIRQVEILKEQKSIDDDSRRYYEEQYAKYQAYLKVLKASDINKASAVKRGVLIYTKRGGDGYDFIARNNHIYHVSVVLKLSGLRNIAPDRALPHIFELAPKSEKKVLHVSVKDAKNSYAFHSNFSWMRGSIDARHAHRAYIVPFRDKRVRVSQGFNGTTSHRGKNAVDFVADVGTPIYAARGGRVVALQERYAKGAFDRRYARFANYIVIEHDDKTLGNYYHLKQNGVVPKLGDIVKTGELIGYSGNTGYTSGPHLHFSVTKVRKSAPLRSQSIDVRFSDGKKILRALRRGDVIEM